MSNETSGASNSFGYMLLLRHAATANNTAIPPRLQGRRSDMSLSADGLEQAAQTASYLSQRPIHAVYSSPLLRAVETAQRIAAPHGLTVEALSELIECDVGDWEGRDWGEIERTEPEAFRKFVTDPACNPYAGGENLEQVRTRVAPVLDRLATSNLGRTIVVVAHNLVNRVYLAKYLGVPIAKARGIHQDHCGLNLFRADERGVKLITLNAAFHLENCPA